MVFGGHASGATVVIVITTFTAIAGFLTISRLYTRKLIVKNAGIDDLLIAVGLVLSVALTVTMCEQVVWGMGQHADRLTMHDGVMSLRWFWASVWIYYLALWAVKVSILHQYLRILPEGVWRKAAYILMGIITTWTFWAVFSAVFACMPVNSFWDQSIDGICLNRLAVWFANAAVNILTDMGTAVLPIPALRTLRIPAKQKNYLIAIFSLGGTVCVISILRLYSLYVVSKSTDISWDNPLAATYSSLEVNVGIICSCIPTLKGLISRLFPKLRFGDSYGPSRGLSVPLEGDNGADQPAIAELRGDLEKGRLRAEEQKKDDVVEVYELPEHSTSSRGSRLFTSLNIRDSRIRSYCPGLTDEELARENISKFVGFKRFENTRKFGILPDETLLRPKTAPAEPMISKNEEAKVKVREFVERRPSSRKGRVGQASVAEEHLRKESESSLESLEKLPLDIVES